MSKITITEALAERTTIDKRIAKKQEFILNYLFRQEKFKDPLEKEGGSAECIAREMQSISDLQQRKIDLMLAINRANSENFITVNGVTKSISEWIVWKRDVAPNTVDFQNSLTGHIKNVRADLQRKGHSIVSDANATKVDDVVIYIDEMKLSEQIEKTQEILATLDGQLSLRNATILIDL